MISELGAWLRRLLIGEPPPPPSRRRSSQAGTPPTGSARLSYRDAPPPRRSANVKWKRESVKVPRTGLTAWVGRVSPRQKFLVAVAAIALGGVIILALPTPVIRTLPSSTHGYWVTDAPQYAGLAMELRANVVAFKTADSTNPVLVHRIEQVDVRNERGVSRYVVTYQADEGVSELSFRITPGMRPTVTFAHQPLVRWRRLSVNGTMLPRSY